MNILICSHQGETQVLEVMGILKSLGVNPVLFERYRKDQSISYYYDQNLSKAYIRVQDKEYPLDSKTFPVVWYRPKPIILGEIPGEIAKVQEKFCVQEWRVILQSLDLFLSDSLWINQVMANQRAANKPLQLKLAREAGLIIPQTYITNDAFKAVELFKKDRVVYKTLSGFFSTEHAIYTNEIFHDQVLASHTEIAMAPGIFQLYIDKQHELRITLVGEEFFIAQINSQKHRKSEMDWRRHPAKELYEEGVLSPETKGKLLKLHKQLGLVYAAYDFIVDKQGNEVFLECNPSGQWLWVEKMVDMKISQAMANIMLNKEKGYENKMH